YEALALGIPIVTLPSAYMRGRVTAACYHKMGLSDLIAENAADYVKRALRLATDPAFRRELQSRIPAANLVLLEDRETLREIEDYLETAVERARRGQGPAEGEIRNPDRLSTTAESDDAPAVPPPAIIKSEIPNPKSKITIPHSGIPHSEPAIASE